MIRLHKIFTLNSLLNGLIREKPHQFPIRTLYSATSLGIDGYINTRERIKTQLLQSTDHFRSKMLDFTKEDSKNMIFTEDLKNMIYLAENTTEDLELIQKMLIKFHNQNKEIRFGNFVFGPVILRMCYYLKQTDFALKFFNHPEISSLFDQLISYQIMLDMLYNDKRYQDILDTFDLISQRKLEGSIFPKHAILLTFAACYKLNTPESFEYSKKLWQNLRDVGHVPMRRAITFAAALAIAQKSSDIAIEILETANQPQYVTVRNLRVLALVNIGRIEEAIASLKLILERNDVAQQYRQSFLKDVVCAVTEAVNASGSPEQIKEHTKLVKFLIDNGHVTDKTIDDIMCAEVTSVQNSINQQQRYDTPRHDQRFNSQQQPQNYRQRSSFDRYNRNDTYEQRQYQRFPSGRRPGLMDMN